MQFTHTRTCFSHLNFYIITTTYKNTQTRFALGYSTCMGIFDHLCVSKMSDVHPVLSSLMLL